MLLESTTDTEYFVLPTTTTTPVRNFADHETIDSAIIGATNKATKCVYKAGKDPTARQVRDTSNFCLLLFCLGTLDKNT